MKRISLAIIALLLAIPFISNAQWSGTSPGPIYYNSGNVGIGTTILPSGGLLQVAGPIDILSVNGSGTFRIYDGTNFAGGVGSDAWAFSGSNTDFSVYGANNLYLAAGAQKRIAILSNGKVGIGTTTPDELLSVKGVIHSQEVKVDLTGWSDYVFKPTYKLPSLIEVKAFIDKNQHLPEVPSEQELIKNGLNLGEMNKLLMKKVEELTLYLIKDHDENQKEIDQLKQQLNALTHK